MKIAEYLNYLVDFLKDQVKKTNTKGLIVGVSGGIDSAVAVALIKKAMPDNHLALFMPCHSNKNDEVLVDELVAKLDLNLEKIDLTKTYDMLQTSLSLPITDKTKIALANIKPRLRMTTLYAYAQFKGYLVVGTSNRDEWYTGYFTKFGDGASDIAPLIHLLKYQIRQAAELLEIPATIIEQLPSAGLWAGQTDEAELGFSYEQLDNFLQNNEINLDSKIVNKIKTMHNNSVHKREMIKIPAELLEK